MKYELIIEYVANSQLCQYYYVNESFVKLIRLAREHTETDVQWRILLNDVELAIKLWK